MFRFKSIWSLCLFFLLFSTNIFQTLCDCNEERIYAIRSTTDTWTVDASVSPTVVIQPYSGSLSQQWTIQCANRPGLFYIVNNADGQRLDVERTTYPHAVVVNQPDGTLWQEWFLNTQGRIVNAALTSNLEVPNGTFEDGAPLRVLQENGEANQEWLLQEI